MSFLFDSNFWSQADQAVLSGAQWIGKETIAVADWVKAQTKDAVRHGIDQVGDKAADLVGSATEEYQQVKQTATDIANGISNAAHDINQWLFGVDPSNPCVPCQPAAQQPPNDSDKAADGCLLGADCHPTCKKGDTLTRDDIKRARANPVVPSASNSCCARKRAQWKVSGQPPRQITYVNGIETTKAQHCATLQHIADLTCADVIGVYNATEGNRQNLIQSSQDRLLIKAANEGRDFQTHDGRNPAVDSLSDLVASDAEDGKATEIWTHSQGGAITSLALFDADKTLRYEGIPNGLSKVQVKSFGSAAPYWPTGLNAEHYVQVNDLTPNLFGLGDDPTTDAQRAPGGKVIRFSGAPPGPYNVQDPTKDWYFQATEYHSIDDTYLGMEKQEHGGCP